MYLWLHSHLGRDSYKDFTRIFGGIHKGSSNISMEGFIYQEEFI